MELSPANDLCQRWQHRRHSWRHRSEGGFDPSRYHVDPIDELTARPYVTTHHYSGSYGANALAYGLLEREELVGVLALGNAMHDKVLTNVFPQLAPRGESWELTRLVLHDRVPANGESWFVTRAFERAAKAGVRGVVSFSDPVPRRNPDGTVVFAGHIGITYQAKNAFYLGRSTPRTNVLLPNGRLFSPRAMSKIRADGRESGYTYAAQQLLDAGAPARRRGEPANAWLARARREMGATQFRHRGCYRYGFVLGDKAERRTLARQLTNQPYPKQVDLAA